MNKHKIAVCPYCGAERIEKDRYCRFCGAKNIADKYVKIGIGEDEFCLHPIPTDRYQETPARLSDRLRYFSVLGDSISTLRGSNPDGYSVFYEYGNCRSSGVYTPADTWWGRVINTCIGRILVNNSWSGSRVSKIQGKENSFPSGCSDERTSGLHIRGKEGKESDILPDVIIIFLGTNDWGYGVPIRSRNPLKNSVEYFDTAYKKMLKKIHRNYPEAELWCCGLTTSYMSKDADFHFPVRYAGVHIEEYNRSIAKNVDIMRKHTGCGIKYLDIYHYGIPYDTIDGTHPNKAGMETLAALICREISRDSGKNLCVDSSF